MNICIYGAASPQLDQIYYEKTEELGRLMARRGHGLVFGGGETGLMGAAARGVDAEGGYLLGIAPRFFDEPGILYQHCTEFIMTETKTSPGREVTGDNCSSGRYRNLRRIF